MNNATVTSSTFTLDERTAAEQAWDFYVIEIMGPTGLRSDFDARPDSRETLAKSVRRHEQQLVVLRRRLEGFAQYVETLEHLKDRPAAHHSSMQDPPFQQRVITAQTVAANRAMLQALEAYILTLEDEGTTGRERWYTALTVALCIHPEPWPGFRQAVPEGAADPLDENTRRFLEAVRGPG